MSYLRSGVYRAHYMASLGECADLCLGHCYLDRYGNVGLFVQRGFRRHGIGKWMLSELISRHPPPVWANVNPRNKASLALFRNAGFTVCDPSNPMQITMKLEGAPA